ncbi:MAG: peptide MFS transporter [Chloracidobacterium sp.]|nr:peptide MFS transporter [Chloracidobacterium sp.]MDW8216869.1 peptide MFS transporter [Acidobacteriota bacterium]
MTAAVAEASEEATSKKHFFGHPIGLMTLFFTELWERFSYYGMRALLMLYMTAKPESGGLGYSNARAALIYGTYTSAVYLLAMPGGWAADRLLGLKAAVFIGGIVIAAGHFTMAFESEAAFYTGLVLIVLGTGLLKPNISAIVGRLYTPEDRRRDAGFSIFYMGINIGAFIAPLVCGFLAQSEVWKATIARWGFQPSASWHWGFAAAGVGMTLGLVQFIVGFKYLEGVGERPQREDGATTPVWQGLLSYLGVAAALFAVVAGLQQLHGVVVGKLGNKAGYAYIALVFAGIIALVWFSFLRTLAEEELKRMLAIVYFFLASIVFWALFEQAGSSLNLYADRLTDCRIFGFEFPSSYFQSLNALFIIFLAPVFAWMWVQWGERQPSSPLKFSVGILLVAVGFIVAAVGVAFLGGGRLSPWWLVAVYLIHTLGELCLSPVGLSTMTKLAPERLSGLVMGIWFLGPTFGNYIGGLIAGHFDENRPESVGALFYQVAATGIAVAVVAFVLTPFIRRLMGNVR